MQQHSPADRLATTEAMAAELPAYLAGSSLYHNLAVRTENGLEHPVLTLGALLENLRALAAQQDALSPEQRQRLAAVEQQVAQARRAYPEPWLAFLRRELKAVLDSWQWYLDDAQSRQQARDNYRAEVHHRTRLALLLQQLAGDPAAEEAGHRLAKLDNQLRAIWQSGAYAGPPGEEANHSPDDAWWLYGALKR